MARRDVRNHVLFEIATEVANRGMSWPRPPTICQSPISRLTVLQSVVSTRCSSQRRKSPPPSMGPHTHFSVLSTVPRYANILSDLQLQPLPILTHHFQATVEVEELEPRDPALAATIKSMNERGIKTLYGRWLIDGAPRVLLFDTGSGYYKLDEWKADLWSSAGIPSPPDDHETNEAIVFGYLIAWFLGEVSDTMLQAYQIKPHQFCRSYRTFAVRLPREGTGCCRSVPRMAGWCRAATV